MVLSQSSRDMSRSTSVSLEGYDEFIALLDKFQRNHKKAADKALLDTALKLKELAVAVTPIDKGDLRDSALVDVISGEVLLAFNIEYAAKQHYDTNLNHSQGRSLYLTQTARKNRNQLIELFIKRYQFYVKKYV